MVQKYLIQAVRMFVCAALCGSNLFYYGGEYELAEEKVRRKRLTSSASSAR